MFKVTEMMPDLGVQSSFGDLGPHPDIAHTKLPVLVTQNKRAGQ